jgi:hypothetical protein
MIYKVAERQYKVLYLQINTNIMREKVKLEGSDKEKAYQLWELLKERSLDKEQLEKLIPMTNSFITEFANCIRTQIESEEKNHKIYMESMGRLADQLSSIVADGQISPEERLAVINLISKISDDIKEVQKDRNEKDFKFKTFLLSILALFAMIIVILAGGQNKKNLKG